MKNLLIIACMLTLLISSCKKSSTGIQYTVTVVPLQTLGFSNVPSAVQGQAFIRQLPATGGTPPYTWQVASGSLPPGLSLSTNGRISGTPTSTGAYTYSLQVTDSKGATVKSSYTQNIGGSGTVPFMLLSPQIPAFGQNQDVGYLFFVQGGTLPWVFTISGLPQGVSYNIETGLIYGSPTSASVTQITITLKDANGNEASGSPVTVSFQVNAPVPVGGGGSGSGGCTSPYNGKYIGTFSYTYYVKGQDDIYNPVTSSLQLTLTLKCIASAGGTTVLNITKAVCSDPNFGCQVGGCVPVTPSMATLPADPPTNSSNPSASGQGLIIFFPDGSTIGTANSAGGLNVSSDGRTLSNSLDPSFKNTTWAASGGNFPSGSTPPGGPITEFKSWSLSWSSTK